MRNMWRLMQFLAVKFKPLYVCAFSLNEWKWKKRFVIEGCEREDGHLIGTSSEARGQGNEGELRVSLFVLDLSIWHITWWVGVNVDALFLLNDIFYCTMTKISYLAMVSDMVSCFLHFSLLFYRIKYKKHL